jgi:hypothetical protein
MGVVESVMNPLIASLYPDEKTAKLNAAHAWWPGGLVIGGLLGWDYEYRLELAGEARHGGAAGGGDDPVMPWA